MHPRERAVVGADVPRGDREFDGVLAEQRRDPRPVREPSREAVEAVHDDAIDLAREDAHDETLERRALHGRAADASIVEMLVERTPTIGAPSADEVEAIRSLHGARSLGWVHSGTQNRLPRVDRAANGAFVGSWSRQGLGDIATCEGA